MALTGPLALLQFTCHESNSARREQYSSCGPSTNLLKEYALKTSVQCLNQEINRAKNEALAFKNKILANMILIMTNVYVNDAKVLFLGIYLLHKHKTTENK